MSTLSVESVSKSFGGVQALKDVSFEVVPGVLHALIGPNGSGKSTMVNLISRVFDLDAGRISLGDVRVDSLPQHRVVYQGISRSFQTGRLLDRSTVFDNVLIGGHRSLHAGLLASVFQPGWVHEEEAALRERAGTVLDEVGIAELADFPAGSLSSGDRRMVEIARVLMADPQVILLDEPMAGLDHESKTRLGQLVLALRDRGKTILLVEHDMQIVMSLADKITVLDAGRKIAEGTPGEIQSDPGVIDAYLGTTTVA